MKKSDPKGVAGNLGGIAGYLDLGLRFALSAVLGGLAGYWLDGKFDTQPLLLIIGVMFGATAGFINLYQTVMRLTNAEKSQKKNRKNS